MHMVRLVVVCALAFVLGCGEEQKAAPIAPELPAADLVEVVPIKGDGAAFNRHYIVDEGVFADPNYVSVTEIQSFFEANPYGTRSFLADHYDSGLSAAEILVEAGTRHGINPLVLLVKLQVETGLVSKTEIPSAHLVDRAMGCACPDGGGCSSLQAGFSEQIDCAAGLFRKFLDEISETGTTWTGWGPDRLKYTSDSVDVVPQNAATAALYTYTPWVLRGSGGNWLFWNVYKRYSRHLMATNPNHHWIGGGCASDTTCSFPEGICLLPEDTGVCSRNCMGYCPDTIAPYSSVTFCVDLGTAMEGIPAGWCLARCDNDLFPETEGCAPGYGCVLAERYLHPETSKYVCWPSHLIVW